MRDPSKEVQAFEGTGGGDGLAVPQATKLKSKLQTLNFSIAYRQIDFDADEW